MDYVSDYRKPLLMIHSRADAYSEPKYALRLYELCPSNDKRLAWFEGSQHSMIRYDHTEEYDREVICFASHVFNIQNISEGDQ